VVYVCVGMRKFERKKRTGGNRWRLDDRVGVSYTGGTDTERAENRAPRLTVDLSGSPATSPAAAK